MKTNASVDAARLSLLLKELRSPASKVIWPQFADKAGKESWPSARFPTALAEHELAERDRRRIERHRSVSYNPSITPSGAVRRFPGTVLDFAPRQCYTSPHKPT